MEYSLLVQSASSVGSPIEIFCSVGFLLAVNGGGFASCSLLSHRSTPGTHYSPWRRNYWLLFDLELVYMSSIRKRVAVEITFLHP